MGKAKDYSGQIMGCWQVVERDYNPTSKSHETFWKCKCLKCGSEASVRKTDLDRKPQTCNKCKGELLYNIAIKKGIVKHEDKPIIPGMRFGQLTVLARPTKLPNRCTTHTFALCRCDCGKEIYVDKQHLNGRMKNGIFEQTISCGCTSRSAGEIKIAQILQKYNIDFIEQYKVTLDNDNHIGIFDFYLPNYNIYIEYDGLQHFYAVDFFGGEEALRVTQKRDDRKTKWCQENNYRLVRIPYIKYNESEEWYLNEIFPKS